MGTDDFAARVRHERMTRFAGNKSAAYSFVGVNAATWDRAEAGETLREHARVKIEQALWPEGGSSSTDVLPRPGTLIKLLAAAWDSGWVARDGDHHQTSNPYAEDEARAAVLVAMRLLRQTDQSPAALAEIERIEKEWS